MSAQSIDVDGQPPRDRLIVGYIAGDRGRDAIQLATFLATGMNTELIITLIQPDSSSFHGTFPMSKGDQNLLRPQLAKWIDEALELVPEGIPARGIVWRSSSEAQGLMEAAAEYDARLIVIGARANALMRQFRIGSVAQTLLHASPIPVALAPGGFVASGEVERVTAVFGARPGATGLIGEAFERGITRQVPVRLLSLVQVDRTRPSELREVTELARDFGGSEFEAQAEELLDSGDATVEVVEGDSVEDALSRVEWLDGEIALLGSSRIAQEGRIFLGSRALRLLRVLPVPVVVVPRGFLGGSEDE